MDNITKTIMGTMGTSITLASMMSTSASAAQPASLSIDSIRVNNPPQEITLSEGIGFNISFSQSGERVYRFEIDHVGPILVSADADLGNGELASNIHLRLTSNPFAGEKFSPTRANGKVLLTILTVDEERNEHHNHVIINLKGEGIKYALTLLDSQHYRSSYLPPVSVATLETKPIADATPSKPQKSELNAKPPGIKTFNIDAIEKGIANKGELDGEMKDLLRQLVYLVTNENMSVSGASRLLEIPIQTLIDLQKGGENSVDGTPES